MRLYRAATRHPPRNSEYRTYADRGRALPGDATEDHRRSWDALSAWDTVEGAREAAVDMESARCIVCYDIPDNSGVTYEASGAPGHYDMRGDLEGLKRYLTEDRYDL